jgi:UDP-N-acetylmuramoylalanine--D-glutamate ligase
MENINSKKQVEQINPLLAAREQQLKNVFEHSMEIVATHEKVVYINDSKSISSKLTRESMESIQQPFILITGGDDSETAYEVYSGMNLMHLKAVFYLGSKLGKVVKQFLKQDIIFVTVKNCDEALALSAMYVNENDAILFSPACPSYEAFDNYKNRGNNFKLAVTNFISKEK